MSRIFRLAFRNMLRNKGRSAITAAALLIGVCQMVFGQSGINGFQKSLIEDSVKSKVGAIQVYRSGYLDAERDPLKLDLPDDPALIEKMRAVPGVRAVSRRIYLEGMVGNGSISAGFVATAIDPATEYEVCPFRRKQVARGYAPLSPAETGGVLVGKALADGLRGKQGTPLFVSATTKTGTPNAIVATIHGILPDTGGYFDNKAAVVMPLALAQTLLLMPGRVTEYVLDIEDLERVDEVASNLRRTLGDGYELKTWRDRPQIKQLAKTMSVVMGFAAFLLAVLVTSVIVNTMLMSIYERVREIGTMLALGVRRRTVMAMFVIEGGGLGLIGATVGALCGVGLNHLFSGVFKIPATAIAGEIVIQYQIGADFCVAAVAVATLVAVLAALYPAWKASRMQPVEALRAT